MTNYILKLDHFEGPLDLLLHLIKQEEMDIFRIDLVVLANQYLDYLRLIRFKNLSDAAGFLAMAATLVEFKSRALLPKEAKSADSEEDDEDDLALKLQKRLQEYALFRKAAEFFEQRPDRGIQYPQKSESKRFAELYSDTNSPLRGSPESLLILYEHMLCNLSERANSKVTATTESLTLEEVLEKIQGLLGKEKILLLSNFYADLKSRYDLIAYLLASLQLARDQRAKIYQEEIFSPIWIYFGCTENDVRMLEEGKND